VTTATPALGARASPASAGLADAAVFAAAVFMLLTYSQGWVFPLTGRSGASADSILIRAMFLPAYAAGVLLLALGPWRAVRGLVRQPFLMALMLIAALSLFWSAAPDQTARRVFALVFTTLGGVVLATRFSWASLAEAVGAAFALLALVSLLVAVFVPSLGRMENIFPGSWRGVWSEKNTFGGLMALGAIVCAAAAQLNPPRAGRWWSAAGLSVVLVLASSSKTALVSLVLGAVAFSLVWAVRRGPVAAVAATWLAVVAAAALGALVFLASDTLVEWLGKDATLTGRTRIWAAVLRQIGRRPWRGFGYGAVWDETGHWGPLAWITKDAGFRPDHSHNSWLEQWLMMGVPGLAAWAGLHLQTLAANVVGLYRHKGAYLALPFFVVYTLMTLTESIAVVYNDLRWVIFVAFAVKLALPQDGPSSSPSAAPKPAGIRQRR